MSTVPRLLIASAATVVLLAACDGGGSTSSAESTSGVTVRDSAGIRIVENHDSAWTEATRWRLAAEPDLVIGSIDGSVPGTDFGRVDDALVVDGHVVVADGQTRLLRVFDEDGVWLRDLGGQGDGPFEFRFLQAVFAAGDSVAVWDANRRRAVLLPVDGGTPRAALFPTNNEPGEGEFVELLLPDGRAVVGPTPAYGAALPEGPRTRADRLYRVVREGGAPGDTIGALPYYLAYNFGTERTTGPVLFAPTGSFEPAGADAVWFGWAIDGYELRRIPLDGRDGPEMRVRRAWEASPLPDDIHARVANHFDSSYAAAGLPTRVVAEQREMVDALQIVDPLPAYWDFEVASDGHLWVNDFRRPDEVTVDAVLGRERVGSTRWSVFTPTGRWLGTVDVPVEFAPTAFGSDWVLGVRTDEFDVQWIERYPILQPGS
ncbi:MAG TPA: hypothetical protein VJ925_04350 [Longimicrobiales bacterium]|nr:hypothetical protein [Longimicrobiales bacterium]